MPTIDSLSEREKEVAALLLKGRSNKQIAQELGVTTRTVEFHVTHIYEKLGVKSRAEALLRLNDAQLRESTGTTAAQPAVELRQPAVEKPAGSSENSESFTLSFRRKPVKKLLLIVALLIAVPCLAIGILWAGGLALFMRGPLVKSSNTIVVTSIPIEATYTPWVTPTPYEDTFTPTAPTSTPWTSPTEGVISDIVVQDLGSNRYRFEGVAFTLDPALSTGARGEVVLENRGTPDGPYWDIHPQYVRLTLENYPLSGTFWKPVISVYPVEDYRRLSPLAGETIDKLKARLEQKTQDPGVGVEANVIPFLPLINAGQGFHSNVKYLDFQNGTGIRFLALYAQYPAPVNNQELFYTYQALTADGKHLISITMPVSHPSLPASADALAIPTLQAIANEHGSYRAETYAMLNAQPASTFTPDLSRLDALVQSIQIDR